MRRFLVSMSCLLLPCGCVSTIHSGSVNLQLQVMETEREFAQTMADRDLEAFTKFISTEAVFFTAEPPLRGKQQVVDFWKRYFEGGKAPFSWKPGRVEVLDSGELALSSGPVYDPDGNQFATFTSIWRQESPGTWRIIFDKGNPVSPNP